MKPLVTRGRTWLTVLACGLMTAASTGCQTTVGGQTLPSAYYLLDDVQYFPSGPEEKLWNQIRALEQYKLDQQALGGGLEEGQP